jgi:predicted DNA-binding protein with PD1-like motif
MFLSQGDLGQAKRRHISFDLPNKYGIEHKNRVTQSPIREDEGDMEKEGAISAMGFDIGRCFLGRLAHGSDLLTAVENFCTDKNIKTAVFTMIGALKHVTLGAYDQKQQVYVTFKKQGPLEIVHCQGNVSFKEGERLVHAHATLANINGLVVGGHLFSESIIFAGEIFVQELTGPDLHRKYDKQTGLWLWSEMAWQAV